ncbi:hypothetical protein LCGC14_2812340 [marine sediment metagenome]|uniref:Uncharacterized protein n=1 Tax=marine sediment metagenome TaxID=412755 RepID=A0A0F8YJH6_9ZZZZ
MKIKPSGEYGFTPNDIKKLCKGKGIPIKVFFHAFGINTCALDKNGVTNYYLCDVERALYELGDKDGVFHLWD